MTASPYSGFGSSSPQISPIARTSTPAAGVPSARLTRPARVASGSSDTAWASRVAPAAGAHWPSVSPSASGTVVVTSANPSARTVTAIRLIASAGSQSSTAAPSGPVVTSLKSPPRFAAFGSSGVCTSQTPTVAPGTGRGGPPAGSGVVTVRRCANRGDSRRATRPGGGASSPRSPFRSCRV